MVKNFVKAAVVAGITIAAATTAQAGTIPIAGPGVSFAALTAISAAGATTSPFTLGNFGTASTTGLVSTSTIQLANSGTISFSPDNTLPQAGVYFGTTPSVARSPFDGTNLTPTNYLVAEPNDPVTIDFTNRRINFNLLWGSVDAYNSLNLDFRGDAGNHFDLTITGSEVAQAVGNGFKADGTTSAFVQISGLGGFDEVIATSTTAAFEFDPSVRVPEPASMALLGASLAGIGLIRRKKTVASA